MMRPIHRKLRRGILAMGIFLLAGGTSFAQEVTLRYGHTTGAMLTYHLVLDTPSLQASQTVDVDVTRQVLDVVADTMEIQSSFANGTMIVNGISYPLPIQGLVLTAKMDRRGQVSETTALGSLAGLFTQAGVGTSSTSADIFRALGILEFPESPVSPTGQWTVVKNHTFPNGEVLNATYVYTYEGLVDCSYSASQCAQIQISSQIPLSMYQDLPELRRGMQINGQINIAGTLIFAHQEGKIGRLDETIETSSISIVVGYDGRASAIPVYQKTTVTLELQ